MGQAKQRGNFQDRKSQAIARDKAERERKVQAERDWYNSLTDEERETYHKNLEARAKAQKALAVWMGVAGALGNGFRL